MKKTAVISLIIVFLSCQFSYATSPSGNVMPTKEENQELTQEEIEGIVIGLLRSIDKLLVDNQSMDWEEFIEKVEERQDIEPLQVQVYCTYCIAPLLLLIANPQLLSSLVFLIFHMIIPSCYMCLISFVP